MSYFHKKLKVFFNHEPCNNKKIYKKKNGTNLGRGITSINVSHLKRTTKKVSPKWMIDVNISIPTIKMEKPLEDQEANVAYWYCS